MFSLFTLMNHSTTTIFFYQLLFKNLYQIKFCIKSNQVSFFLNAILKSFRKPFFFLTIIHYIMITDCFTEIMDYFCDAMSQLSRPSLSVASIRHNTLTPAGRSVRHNILTTAGRSVRHNPLTTAGGSVRHNTLTAAERSVRHNPLTSREISETQYLYYSREVSKTQ